jgi:hypothetical protein
MGATFISGGSGCGKTTFCNRVSERYPITLETNVIRSLHKEEDFPLLPGVAKQLTYFTRYLDLHRVSSHLPNFKILSDRSILNVLAFWEIPPETVKYLGLEVIKPDLIILVSPPPFIWYRDHIDYLKDPIRISTYKRKAGIVSELDDLKIAELFYDHDVFMFQDMARMCAMLNWNHFIPDEKMYNIEDFQGFWQREAEAELVRTWNLEEIKNG